MIFSSDSNEYNLDELSLTDLSKERRDKINTSADASKGSTRSATRRVKKEKAKGENRMIPKLVSFTLNNSLLLVDSNVKSSSKDEENATDKPEETTENKSEGNKGQKKKKDKKKSSKKIPLTTLEYLKQFNATVVSRELYHFEREPRKMRGVILSLLPFDFMLCHKTFSQLEPINTISPQEEFLLLADAGDEFAAVTVGSAENNIEFLFEFTMSVEEVSQSFSLSPCYANNPSYDF